MEWPVHTATTRRDDGRSILLWRSVRLSFFSSLNLHIHSFLCFGGFHVLSFSGWRRTLMLHLTPSSFPNHSENRWTSLRPPKFLLWVCCHAFFLPLPPQLQRSKPTIHQLYSLTSSSPTIRTVSSLSPSPSSSCRQSRLSYIVSKSVVIITWVVGSFWQYEILKLLPKSGITTCNMWNVLCFGVDQ